MTTQFHPKTAHDEKNLPSLLSVQTKFIVDETLPEPLPHLLSDVSSITSSSSEIEMPHSIVL